MLNEFDVNFSERSLKKFLPETKRRIRQPFFIIQSISNCHLCNQFHQKFRELLWILRMMSAARRCLERQIMARAPWLSFLWSAVLMWLFETWRLNQLFMQQLGITSPWKLCWRWVVMVIVVMTDHEPWYVRGTEIKLRLVPNGKGGVSNV